MQKNDTAEGEREGGNDKQLAGDCDQYNPAEPKTQISNARLGRGCQFGIKYNENADSLAYCNNTVVRAKCL